MSYTNILTKNTIVYPRENNEKYYTDKYLIHIIANKNFYERVIDSVEKVYVIDDFPYINTSSYKGELESEFIYYEYEY